MGDVNLSMQPCICPRCKRRHDDAVDLAAMPTRRNMDVSRIVQLCDGCQLKDKAESVRVWCEGYLKWARQRAAANDERRKNDATRRGDDATAAQKKRGGYHKRRASTSAGE